MGDGANSDAKMGARMGDGAVGNSHSSEFREFKEFRDMT